MLEALVEYLVVKPGLCQNEMAVFLYDKFGILLSISGISRVPKRHRMEQESYLNVVQERNADLRDFY
jgi:hypothetical protein